jgi:hypothetical protein
MALPRPRRRTLRRAAGVLVFLALLAGLGSLADEGSPADRPFVHVSAYRGLGMWVDVYDASAWADPAAAVAAMEARGVRTLFLQTSNFSRPSAFVFPGGVARFVDAAHRAGISVVAWYLPGFAHPSRDLHRVLAAIRFRTPEGNRFDSLALDIESSRVKDVSVRTRRLLALSERLRAAAGSAYPLGAIIPSPLGMRANPAYWPGFPYAELASLYDVILPMTYFTWRASGPAAVQTYTSGCVEAIRAAVEDPSLPIHVIGGIAGDATAAETRAFVRAVDADHVLGASFYTFPLVTRGEWTALAPLRGPP